MKEIESCHDFSRERIAELERLKAKNEELEKELHEVISSFFVPKGEEGEAVGLRAEMEKLKYTRSNCEKYHLPLVEENLKLVNQLMFSFEIATGVCEQMINEDPRGLMNHDLLRDAAKLIRGKCVLFHRA